MLTTYSASLDKTELMQGDVLARTPHVDALLKEIHPHFHKHQKNLYFMVLTQSCDLVQRQGGACKAPYITIAAVRSLDVVIQRHLQQLHAAAVDADLPIIGDRAKTRVTDFLQRLHNNNEPGLFYLNSVGTPLPNDCVAFLNLSIAIKADLHYEKCLEAKTLQLTDTFQAKLGWLVGQLYSRVGTEDWDAKELQKKIAAILGDAAIWVDESKLKYIEDCVANDEAPGEQRRLSPVDVAKLIRKAPTKKRLVLAQAQAVMHQALGEEGRGVIDKVMRRLENDEALTGLLK